MKLDAVLLVQDLAAAADAARCGFAQRIAIATAYGVDPGVLPALVRALRA